MKKYMQKVVPVLGLIAAAVLACAGLWLDERIPAGLSGLLFGGAGALTGVCVTAIVMDCIQCRWTPEQRKEAQRGETDERNVAIRKEAAQASWYWTLYLLWGLFILCLFLHQPLYIALSAAVIVLHCVFYLVNISRWAKKM